MIVAVTGGRDFDDREFIHFILDGLHHSNRITTLRNGGASGVDLIAYGWARSRQVPVQTFNPDWEQFGKRAGPDRNRRMLAAEPLCGGVVAFPGGRGTADCVRQARRLGFPVFDVSSLYAEWLDRQINTSSFGDAVVAATKALMDQIEADGADSGVLKLDLGGKGELPPQIGRFGRILPPTDPKEAPDVLE